MLLELISRVVGKAADKFFPDPKDEIKREELKQTLNSTLIDQAGEIMKTAASVVMAEVQGKGWLQRSWRPLAMMVFLAIIVSRMYGWTDPNISETEASHLWQIVKIGLGGYVFMRSGEKVLPGVVKSLKNGGG